MAINIEWNKTIIKDERVEGRDVVVDIYNNIYVVGNAYNSTKGVFDIIIIKYNNLGNQIWNRTWGGYSNDYGYAIDYLPWFDDFLVASANMISSNLLNKGTEGKYTYKDAFTSSCNIDFLWKATTEKQEPGYGRRKLEIIHQKGNFETAVDIGVKQLKTGLDNMFFG